ncbi:MAG: hypothetical protein AABY84_07385 [Candidatus Firestonebacteria bacterium]
MVAFFWGFYLLLLVISVLLVFANIISKGYQQISLSQMILVICFMPVQLFFFVARNVAGVVIVVFVFFILLIYLAIPEKSKTKILRQELADKMVTYKKALNRISDNPVPAIAISEIYEQIGEIQLVLTYLKKSYSIYADKEVQGKINFLERNFKVNPDFKITNFNLLHACPVCESIEFHHNYVCENCGHNFFSNRIIWFITLFNHLYESYDMTKVLLVGLLILPYLFYGGHWSYLILWVFCSLGILSLKSNEKYDSK